MKHRSGWKSRLRPGTSVKVIAARLGVEATPATRQARRAAIDAPTVPITVPIVTRGHLAADYSDPAWVEQQLEWEDRARRTPAGEAVIW